MTILILGSNSYISKYFVKTIDKNKYKVFGLGKSGKLNVTGLTYYQCDISNKQHVTKIVLKVEPDIILYSIVDYEKNSTLVLNIYDAIVELSSIKKYKIIYLSSCAVYGNVDNKKIKETDLVAPIDSYGKNKLYEENWLTRVTNNIDVDLIILRIFNITGPGEPSRQLGGSLINKIKKKDYIDLRNSDCIRDFVDIRDIASVVLLLCSNTVYNGLYNVCTGVGTSVYDIFKHILSNTTNMELIKYKLHMHTNGNGVKSIIGDNYKITKYVNWKIKYDIKDSIRALCDSKNNI